MPIARAAAGKALIFLILALAYMPAAGATPRPLFPLSFEPVRGADQARAQPAPEGERMQLALARGASRLGRAARAVPSWLPSSRLPRASSASDGEEGSAEGFSRKVLVRLFGEGARPFAVSFGGSLAKGDATACKLVGAKLRL